MTRGGRGNVHSGRHAGSFAQPAALPLRGRLWIAGAEARRGLERADSSATFAQRKCFK
jgi:hypothetical protein